MAAILSSVSSSHRTRPVVRVRRDGVLMTRLEGDDQIDPQIVGRRGNLTDRKDLKLMDGGGDDGCRADESSQQVGVTSGVGIMTRHRTR